MRFLHNMLCFIIAISLSISVVFAQESLSQSKVKIESFISHSIQNVITNDKYKNIDWAKYSLNLDYCISDININNNIVNSVGATIKLSSLLPHKTMLNHYKDGTLSATKFWETLNNSFDIKDYNIKISFNFNLEHNKNVMNSKLEYNLYKAFLKLSSNTNKAYNNNLIKKIIVEGLVPSEFGTVNKNRRIPLFSNLTNNQLNYIDSYNFSNKDILPGVLYGLKDFNITISNPNKCSITFKSPNYMNVYNTAVQKVKANLAMQRNINNLDDSSIKQFIIAEFNNQIVYIKHKKTEKYYFEFNLFNLNNNVFKQYIEDEVLKAIYVNLQNSLEDIKAYISKLPSYPEVKKPKTGSINGARRAMAKCTFKKEDNDKNNYTIFIINSNGSAADQGFINSKHKACTLYVPKDKYTILIGSGDKWYGDRYMFGSLGKYLRSDVVNIDNIYKSYSFTINPEAGANVLASFEEFESIIK